MRQALKAFIAEERGAALIEYSLLACLLALGIVSALSDLGQTLGGLYDGIRLGIISIGTPG